MERPTRGPIDISTLSRQSGAFYLYQLKARDGFWKTAAQWGGVSARNDGGCPMAIPTTAEILQWAKNKWRINPLLRYAEARPPFS
jgi:hypothetical protein